MISLVQTSIGSYVHQRFSIVEKKQFVLKSLFLIVSEAFTKYVVVALTDSLCVIPLSGYMYCVGISFCLSPFYVLIYMY